MASAYTPMTVDDLAREASAARASTGAAFAAGDDKGKGKGKRAQYIDDDDEMMEGGAADGAYDDDDDDEIMQSTCRTVYDSRDLAAHDRAAMTQPTRRAATWLSRVGFNGAPVESPDGKMIHSRASIQEKLIDPFPDMMVDLMSRLQSGDVEVCRTPLAMQDKRVVAAAAAATAAAQQRA